MQSLEKMATIVTLLIRWFGGETDISMCLPFAMTIVTNILWNPSSTPILTASIIWITLHCCSVNLEDFLALKWEEKIMFEADVCAESYKIFPFESLSKSSTTCADLPLKYLVQIWETLTEINYLALLTDNYDKTTSFLSTSASERT
jgi:hypothetical protein